MSFFPLEQLPLELLLNLFSFLNLKDLAHLSLVNSYFEDILEYQIWETPLRDEIYSWACKNGDLPLVIRALKHGSDISVSRKHCIGRKGALFYEYHSTLSMALPRLKRLYRAEVSADIHYNQMAVFQYLVKHGAVINGSSPRLERKHFFDRLMSLHNPLSVPYDRVKIPPHYMGFCLEHGSTQLLKSIATRFAVSNALIFGVSDKHLLKLESLGVTTDYDCSILVYAIYCAMEHGREEAFKLLRPKVYEYENLSCSWFWEMVQLAISRPPDPELEDWVLDCLGKVPGNRHPVTWEFSHRHFPARAIFGKVLNAAEMVFEFAPFALLLFSYSRGYWLRSVEAASSQILMVKQLLEQSGRLAVKISDNYHAKESFTSLDARRLLLERAEEEGFSETRVFQDIMALIDAAPEVGEVNIWGDPVVLTEPRPEE